MYLKKLKELRAEGVAVPSGTFMIELNNTSTSNSWVLDTGCGTHICTNVQGLQRSRRLENGKLDLIMGNKNVASVSMIREYKLVFNSDLCIVLSYIASIFPSWSQLGTSSTFLGSSYPFPFSQMHILL